VILAAAVAAICAAPISGADRMDTKIDAYSRRSIQIVAIAQKKDFKSLVKLVAPNAKFNIGRGDVGSDLGSGVEGAIAAGSEIYGAPRYRFRHRTGPPPGPDEPCSAIDVEVEFYSRDEQTVLPIKFSYDRGLLTSAQGWIVYESAGEIDAGAK
jgi:hypothetical protein